MRVNVRFSSVPVETERTLEVARAFGLDLDGSSDCVVYDNFVLDVKRGDGVEKALEALGFDVRKMRSRRYNATVLQRTDDSAVKAIVRRRLSDVSAIGPYRNGGAETLLENDLAAFLTLVPSDDTVWLGWWNENAKDDPPKTERERRR